MIGRALRRPARRWSRRSWARSSRAGCSRSTSTSCRPRSAQACHVWLPAATSGEMNLTSMNGERRMRLTERYMDPPGQAHARLPDRRAHRQPPGARLPRAWARTQLRRPVQGLRLADRRRRLHGRLPPSTRRAASSSPTRGCGRWAPTASRSRRPASTDGKIIGTKRLYRRRQVRHQGRQGRPSWRRNGAACRRPARRSEKDKFAVPDQQRPHQPRLAERLSRPARTSSSWTAGPIPFIEMNPEDMARAGPEAGRSRRGLQRQRLDPGDGLSDADGEARSRPSCCSPTRPACRATSSSPGVNEFIIPNYKQTWGNIRKIADAPEGVQHLTFKSQEYSA